MFKVTFRFENGETVEGFAAAEENLLEVARKTNVAIDAPCSGNGSCGIRQEPDILQRKNMQRGGDCPVRVKWKMISRWKYRISRLPIAAE